MARRRGGLTRIVSLVFWALTLVISLKWPPPPSPCSARFLTCNAQPATAFFGIPPSRVMEIGSQIEI